MRMKKKPQLTYARAVFKYKGQNALDQARKGISGPAIDLSDVPPQTPIPNKSKGRMKEGASEYTGVSFNRATLQKALSLPRPRAFRVNYKIVV